MMTEAELMASLKDWVRQHSRLPEAKRREIADDTDLLASGLLDSLGFVELLVWAEERTGHTMDLEDADPEAFTRVNGFCRLALASAGRAT